MSRFVSIVVLVSIACAAVRADLPSYVEKPDPSYSWKRIDEPPADAADLTAELRMVSQTWRGIEWKHKLFIIRPPDMEKGTHAILVIAGGSWDEARDTTRTTEKPKELAIARGIAAMAKMPVAFVLQVPFQPMFDGRKEDQIISYTFDKYIKTGEEDWPLLLPMTKAAVRAMDTVQAFTKKEWKLDIRQFVVTGGSKRGWTTWLTGVVDKRAVGIAPMVIDVLNMPAQMKHQLEMYGRYSEQIKDYTNIDLPKQLETEKGRKLVSIVDPYAYRKQLTMPKLIILGSNDPFWTLDAANLYYNDLEGEKYILYSPNAGHGPDMLRVVSSASAFARKVAGKLAFPKLIWDMRDSEAGLKLAIRSDIRPTKVCAWTTTSATKDFRKSKWEDQELELTDGAFVHELKRPAEGYAAVFGEAVYTIDGLTFYLSTNVRFIGTP